MAARMPPSAILHLLYAILVEHMNAHASPFTINNALTRWNSIFQFAPQIFLPPPFRTFYISILFASALDCRLLLVVVVDGVCVCVTCAASYTKQQELKKLSYLLPCLLCRLPRATVAAAIHLLVRSISPVAQNGCKRPPIWDDWLQQTRLTLTVSPHHEALVYNLPITKRTHTNGPFARLLS